MTPLQERITAEVDAEIAKQGVLDVIWTRKELEVVNRYRRILIEGAMAMARMLGIKR